jgi:uncharacterized membrane protein YtjA (UPF0391 family)
MVNGRRHDSPCQASSFDISSIPQPLNSREPIAMLKWALIFAVIAIVAGLFGFTGIAAGSAAIAKFLFGLFLVLCIIFVVIGVVVAKRVVK